MRLVDKYLPADARALLAVTFLCAALTACGGGGDTTSSSGGNSSSSAPSSTFGLSISKSGSGTITSSPSGVSCGSTCSTNFANGTSVTLTRAAGNGYVFSGWGGACSGTGTTCTVSMTASRSVSATFTASNTTGPATLTWEAPNQNNDGSCLTDLSGYRFHRGGAVDDYTILDTVMVNAISCTNSGASNACGTIPTCTYTFNNLASGTWYFSIQAFNTAGNESGYSNAASKTIQ